MKMLHLSPFTRLSSSLACLSAISLLLFTQHTLHATTLSFQEGVSQDGTYTTDGVTIRSNVPDENQNEDDEIIVGHYGSGSNLTYLRGLLEFDLTAIETATSGSDFTIDSVSLIMHTASVSTTGSESTTFNLSLLGSNSDFEESEVTWNNAPDTEGATTGTLLSSVSFIPSSTTNTDQTFASTTAFTTAVSNALSSGTNTISLILSTDETGSSSFARFVSDESSSLEYRPELVVNYTLVPEPSAFALLLGSASISVCFQRRRHV
jgi:hypothetical protein